MGPTDVALLELTQHNLTSTIEASPHLWLINYCRISCGFCQSLHPHWERLAHTLRNEVHVAYLDAEESATPPALLGDVSSTPAIRAVLRRPDGPPRAVDYQGLRAPEDLARFARAHMPDHVVRVEADAAWAELARQAANERLPRAVVFTSRDAGSHTPPMLKRLSTDFQSRLLVAEVRPGADASLAALQRTLSLTALPAVIGLPAGADAATEPMRFRWSHAPTYARLHEFMASLAGPASAADRGPQDRDEL